MESKKFGRYEIKGEIGRGGMATVYHAYDPRFEREVAIKVLPHEMLHDVQFRTRFEREAKTIAMLEHPAIVPVYDFGEEEGQPYFVMRYMTGGSLSDRIKKGPMRVQEAAQLVAHIAPGLNEAHAKHIIHRDLKPGNILFDQFNEPYISDFGIAKLSEAQTNVTGNAIVGTPAYMSPEQAQGESIDGRSDIYALGVILFEMLTGQQPYHGDTPMSVVVKQITDPVPHILDVKPDLPPDMELIIEKAMAKDRSERFQDVKSLSNALSAVARGERLSLGSSEATMVAPGKTVVAAKPTSQPLPGTVIAQRPPVAERAQVPQVLEPVQAPVAPSRKFGLWIGLGAGILILLVAAGIGIIYLRNKTPGLAAAIPTQTNTVVQASPTATVVIPSATSVVVVPPAASEAPAATETPEPSPTPTVPSLPSIGGADQIAFLSARDIWLANVDGTNASQLTKDGADKKNLQWAPDGLSLFYISGKCIHSVTILDGEIKTITCFTTSSFVEAFEISPDGTQVAISVNHVLFIVPLDVTALSGAKSVGQLALLPGDIFKYPDITQGQTIKQVRWQKTGKRIAAVYIMPLGGQTIDNIEIFDLTSCTSANPCDGSTFFRERIYTQFPYGRFEMIGFGIGGGKFSIIPSFDWNAEGLFLLNSINRNGVYGYLYSYNTATYNGEMIDPLGSQCCYADARWSPDGTYVLFSYQDVRLGNASRNQLYYIPYGSIGTGAKYTPLPLPDGILSNISDHPDPALRPVK
jgi:tRNA A-37 threonylcarbamoyl transferase component Bud32/Tol biopolymer transport system component